MASFAKMFKDVPTVDARGANINNVSDNATQINNNISKPNHTHNYGDTIYNHRGVVHNDHSTGAQSSNHYSTPNSTDNSSRPIYNTYGDARNPGMGPGSDIHGDLNNYRDAHLRGTPHNHPRYMYYPASNLQGYFYYNNMQRPQTQPLQQPHAYPQAVHTMPQTCPPFTQQGAFDRPASQLCQSQVAYQPAEPPFDTNCLKSVFTQS